MLKFYFLLWLGWVARVSFFSIFWAGFFSLLGTVFIYISQGSIELNGEVIDALLKIFLFWFPILWSATLLLGLFRGIKFIFNRCVGGYELKLLECSGKEFVEVIGFGNLVKVWRKWFFLIIWLSATQVVLVSVILYFVNNSIEPIENARAN